MRTKIFLWLLLCWSGTAIAQSRKDSLQALRQFLQISRTYQQAPMHAQVSIQTRSNLPGTGDTSTVEAEFYVLTGGVYVRFGELEELMSDSLALMVSHDLRRMTLYTDAREQVARSRSLMSMGITEASLAQMATTCRISPASVTAGKGMIRVASIRTLQGTAMASDSITLEYNAATREPLRIVQTARSLLPLDKAAYDSLQAQPGWKDRLVDIPGKGRYVVREQSTTFLYRSIEHRKETVMPALITDRIAKTGAGAYEPLPAYNNYLLTQN